MPFGQGLNAERSAGLHGSAWAGGVQTRKRPAKRSDVGREVTLFRTTAQVPEA